MCTGKKPAEYWILNTICVNLKKKTILYIIYGYLHMLYKKHKETFLKETTIIKKKKKKKKKVWILTKLRVLAASWKARK